MIRDGVAVATAGTRRTVKRVDALRLSLTSSQASLRSLGIYAIDKKVQAGHERFLLSRTRACCVNGNVSFLVELSLRKPCFGL